MYYSAIGLLAAVLLVMENQDILIGRDAFGRSAWKVYRGFLFAVLVYYITDILWGVFESFRLTHLLFADTTIYYVAMAAGLLLWARYIVAYLGEDNGFGKFIVIAGRTVAGVIAILAAVNIFIPVLFTVDDECVYHALPVRYVILSAQIMLFLLISAYAVSSYIRFDTDKRRVYRMLAVFGLLMAAFLLLQL